MIPYILNSIMYLGAQAPDEESAPLQEIGQAAESGELSCADIAGSVQYIIDIIFLVAGLVFVIVIMLGGLMYLTSAGNPEGAQRAQQTLIWGVVGTAITVLMVAIATTWFELLGFDGTKLLDIGGLLCGT